MLIPIPAYKGNDPYVFVSYSHADDREVYAEIRWLQDQGINVWYDAAGIGAGAEWNDEIARAIKGTVCFLYFITPASVRSEHCRRELNFAQSKEKRVLSVHLKETEVPDGLRLSLENRQAVFIYRMTRADYEQALLQALSIDQLAQATAAHLSKLDRDSSATTRHRTWVVASIVAILVLATAAWLTSLPEEIRSTPDTSIAVLPFIDLSPDGDQQHIGDGIAEEILNELTGLKGLRVAARSSSFAVRGREEDLRSIADALGVSTIVEGSVRRGGDRIRVAAQLVNAADGFQLWSRTYERQLTDLFTIQSDIAEAVAANLGVTLGVGGVNAFRGAGTNSIEAYEAYLQAQSPTASTVERLGLLERAVKLDKNYAAAWAALGLNLASTMWDSPPEKAPSIISEAVPHLMRAVELEPDSAYAYTLLATVNYATMDWIKSEELYQQALAVSSDGEAFINYGNMLMRSGRSLEAVSAYQAALRIEPSIELGSLSIHAPLALGRYDSVRNLVEAMPSPEKENHRLLIALNEGDPYAIKGVLAELSNVTASPLIASLLRDFSDPEKVRDTLNEAHEDPAVWPSKYHDIALLAAYFGDADLSLRAISSEARLTAIRLGTLWYPIIRT